MVDITPELAQLAAMANGGVAAPGGLPASVVQALNLSAYGGTDPQTIAAATPVAYGVNPGQPRRKPVQLAIPQQPAGPPAGPPPTPDVGVPQGPPLTPNANVPQGPPATPDVRNPLPPGSPQVPPPPQPTPNQMIDPQRVIRPVAGAAAAAGRKGDSMVGHLTPGDLVVPQQMRDNPELARMLAAAFAQRGADPRQFVAGSRAASVNPATGLQEFGFLDGILGMIIPGIAGLASGGLLGPLLTPALGGFLGPAVASGIGATAGNLITGRPLLPAILGGFGGSLASGAVGSLFGGAGGGIGAGASGAAANALSNSAASTAANTAAEEAAHTVGSAVAPSATTAALSPVEQSVASVGNPLATEGAGSAATAALNNNAATIANAATNAYSSVPGTGAAQGILSGSQPVIPQTDAFMSGLRAASPTPSLSSGVFGPDTASGFDFSANQPTLGSANSVTFGDTVPQGTFRLPSGEIGTPAYGYDPTSNLASSVPNTGRMLAARFGGEFTPPSGGAPGAPTDLLNPNATIPATPATNAASIADAALGRTALSDTAPIDVGGGGTGGGGAGTTTASHGIGGFLGDKLKEFLTPVGLAKAAAGWAGGEIGGRLGDMLAGTKKSTSPTDQNNQDNLQLATLDELRRRYGRVPVVPPNSYLQTYGQNPATPAVSFFQPAYG